MLFRSIDGVAGSNTLVGDAGEDAITGGTGTDIITGGADVDTLDGGTGNNTFVYQATADLFTGTAIVDSITGGSDTDTILIDNTGAQFDIQAEDSWADRITAIESITAKATNQIISIVANDNMFEAGITKIDLSGDTDTGSVNIIDVSRETGANNFTLTGSAGKDVITGGAGADTISGGTESDTFIFKEHAAEADTDTIKDFTPGAIADEGDVLYFSESDLGFSADGATTYGKIGIGTGIDPTAFKVVGITDSIAFGDAWSTVATFIDSAVDGSSMGTGDTDDTYFLVTKDLGSSTFETRVYYWEGDYVDGSDDHVNASELELITTLTNFNTANINALVDTNFQFGPA